LSEPLRGFVAAKANQPAAKRRADFLARAIPESILGKLRTIVHGALRTRHAIP
jgi:hypothetical protein